MTSKLTVFLLDTPFYHRYTRSLREFALTMQPLTDRTLADYNENFLTDILSDEDGLSFHRFQIFVWSLVLGRKGDTPV
jgi:hypothetical protein